jgi:hypothetical protein
MQPRARTDDLVVERLGDEVLVYDQRTEKCHMLNRAAAAVWRRCDGQAGPAELAAAVAAESGLPARDEVVALALDQLRRADLLEGADEAAHERPLSRRALVRRLGLAAGLAALLPMVESLVVPRAADAQSGVLPSTTAISDARLKRDIAPVGRLGSGLTLYRFRYRWSPEVYVGVMAQEVRRVDPEAVVTGAGGVLRVDYGRLGIRMLTWRQWQRGSSLVAAVCGRGGSEVASAI